MPGHDGKRSRALRVCLTLWARLDDPQSGRWYAGLRKSVPI